MAPQSRGGQELKTTDHNQFLNTQYFLLCCFFVIIVPLLFVELKVALLFHFKTFKMKKK
jgi:hypothetical protein